MKSYLKNYRQSPRKVRLVAGLIRGKKVSTAIAELDFLAKRAGFPIKKLLMSAVAAAKEQGKEMENLFIKELRVDKGVTLKRMMPAAMGTGHRINKRTSHIALLLGEKDLKAKSSKNLLKKVKEEKVEKKTEVKKVSAKGGSASGGKELNKTK